MTRAWLGVALRAGVAGGALLAASTAAAQTVKTAPPAADTTTAVAPDTTADIIVTAEKRSERLVDVPASVSVVNADSLRQQGLTTSESLTQAIPSLSLTSGVSSDASGIKIRGLGTQVFSVGVEPSVSYIVDGVVLSREIQGLGDLFDVDQVEVLRGPQSTLFGKNASAGVINIVTKGPTRDLQVEAFGLATTDDEYQANLAISGPIGEASGQGFRVSGFYNNRQGFIRNVLNGDRYNGNESGGGRAKLVLKPADALTVTLTGDYRKNVADCCAFTARTIVNPSTRQFIAPVVPSRTNQRVNINKAPISRVEQYGGAVQLDYDAGPATLTSITAYRYLDSLSDQDIDNTPLSYVAVGTNAYVQLNRNFGDTRSKTFSQEVRVASTDNGPIRYTFGAFYFDAKLRRFFDRLSQVCLVTANATRPIGTDCGTLGLARNLPAGFDARIHDQSLAGFGEVQANVAGPLTLIGGLRVNYQKLTSDFSVFNTAAALNPTTVRFADRRGASDTVLLGRGGVKLALAPSTNLFATYSKGYKGYAFDLTTSFTPAIAALQPIAPERSNAYELNLKSSLLDRRLNLNATLFRTDYTGFQVQAFDTTAAAFRLLNAGTVRSGGLELEATARPDRNFTFSAGFTYAKTRVRRFPGGPCYAGQPVVATAAGQGAPLTCSNNGTAATGDDTQNLAGGRLPGAPDYRVSVNANWAVPLAGSIRPFVGAGVVYQSDTTFALNQNPGTIQDGYALVNANLGVRDDDGRFEVNLFVRNLFDTHYATAIFEAPVNNSPAGNFFQVFTRDTNRYGGVSARFTF